MRVEQSPQEGLYRPSIDALFRSAALTYGRRTIGVLLTGMLNDGTAGLWQIKKRGGVTIVQDPEDAQFQDMPRSAITEVVVDFVLPLQSIALKLVELTRQHPSGSEPRTVLIVEDEAVVAENLERGLKELGYVVIGSVPTAETALEVAAGKQPDIVLMDIHLAGPMKGFEAARRIWERFQIPVVYVTAYADSETLNDAKTTENYGYIVKPFHTQAVHAAIQIALARREKEMRLQ